jgi:hypothetical protein
MTTYLYNVRLEHEREVSELKARAWRERARGLELTGQRLAADILRAAARVCDDSARYWELEIRSQRERAISTSDGGAAPSHDG